MRNYMNYRLMSIQQMIRWTIFILFWILLHADIASAHKVVIFGWIEGDTIYTESQYPDGKRVKNGKILVYDAGDKELMTGTTSDNGEFSFKIPKASPLRVVIQAGMGHQGEWKFSEQEITAAVGGPMPSGASNTPAAIEPAPPMAAPTDTRTIENREPDVRQLEQMMERVVDKKLRPITQMLAEMQNKGPTANDIFGGIGYILGLMGVAAYFLSKKNQTKK